MVNQNLIGSALDPTTTDLAEILEDCNLELPDLSVLLAEPSHSTSLEDGFNALDCLSLLILENPEHVFSSIHSDECLIYMESDSRFDAFLPLLKTLTGLAFLADSIQLDYLVDILRREFVYPERDIDPETDPNEPYPELMTDIYPF